MHHGIERNWPITPRTKAQCIARKAFDRVDYYKIFAKLIDRYISLVVIRFMLNLYTNQISRVKWNDVFSLHFPIHNGVRQNAISSPTLLFIHR
jgi:hypothetical protein